jgi:H+/Cl- antiporter ClcA
MLLVYLAWALVVAMFAAALCALHTVPIYTHSRLQRTMQQVYLRRLLVVCSALGLCACLLLFLHFAVADVPPPPPPPPPPPVNASAQSS